MKGTGIVLTAVYASLGAAQSCRNVTPAGGMATPWQLHTAALLPGGKVPIAGGFSDYGPSLTGFVRRRALRPLDGNSAGPAI